LYQDDWLGSRECGLGGGRTHEGSDDPVQDEGQDDLSPDMYRPEQSG
jgi:hypothetical protein